MDNPNVSGEFLTPEHHDLHLAFISDPKNADKVARSQGLIEAHIQEEKQRLATQGGSPQMRAQGYQQQGQQMPLQNQEQPIMQ